MDQRAWGVGVGGSWIAQLVKTLPAMQEIQVQFLGLGRSPEERNFNSFQYSCLENSMDREAWQGTVHGIAKSDVNERLILSLSFLIISIIKSTFQSCIKYYIT